MIVRNSISQRVVEDDTGYPADALTAEEVATIQARIPLKIYEPVAVANEVVFADNGDVVVSFGGQYAA